MFLLPQTKGRFRLRQNVEIVLRDKNGEVKPLFQPNKLLLEFLKRGFINPLSDYAKTPGLFGHWADRMNISNLTTTAGKGGVASRINGSGAEAAFVYIAVGTGTTAANIADTTLEAEIVDSGLARASATASRVTTDTTNDTAQLVYTFSVSGTKAVTESGVLNASSNGVLLARQVFSAINVVSGDSLQVTWKFDVD